MSAQRASPNPYDARDLARSVADDERAISEDTLERARDRILEMRAQADGEERNAWDDALEAVHGALGRVRRGDP